MKTTRRIPFVNLGDRLTRIRVSLLQTRRQQAASLRVNERTLARWVAGQHAPDPTSPIGVRLLAYLKEHA